MTIAIPHLKVPVTVYARWATGKTPRYTFQGLDAQARALVADLDNRIMRPYTFLSVNVGGTLRHYHWNDLGNCWYMTKISP